MRQGPERAKQSREGGGGWSGRGRGSPREKEGIRGAYIQRSFLDLASPWMPFPPQQQHGWPCALVACLLGSSPAVHAQAQRGALTDAGAQKHPRRPRHPALNGGAAQPSPHSQPSAPLSCQHHLCPASYPRPLQQEPQ